MAKLHFKYGAMNSGKTTVLLQTAHNYEERCQKVIIVKPEIDTKGEEKIVSRLGSSRKVDILLKEKDSVLKEVKPYLKKLNAILIDEAEFLTGSQVEEFFQIAKLKNIPVIAFGLRTNFQSKSFEGSRRLLELADSLEELPTICWCGKKARFNARKVNGEFSKEGREVVIDGSDDQVVYEALCGKCYLEKVERKNS